MTERPLVRVLGPVRFPDRAGVAAEPSGAMPRRLLAALALAGGSGRSVAGLTDDLWPDDPPRNPRAAIQMLVSRIRSGAAEGLLESTATGYRVAGSDLAVAEQADAAGAAEALALWTGDPGADLDDGPLGEDLAARAAAARLRLLRLAADDRLAAGRPAEAIPLLERLVDAAPLDGAPVGLLMRAQADLGRSDAALSAFATHRERLAEALGADPEPELVRLNTELLRGQAAPESAELVGVRAATTPLLGRDEDLRRLVATVPAHRLTSIIGTGGLGKTRLAHETALRLADRFERIVFTELVGARAAEDVELVVGAAAGARGLQRARRLNEPMPPDLPTRTREVLGARRTLLVLDNCEHVVDAVAALAGDLLATVPGLTVLTTSRVPLLVPGEAVVAPQPLPAATDAAALFTDRATAARPGVALDRALVERVCARLDGLPLAIELAAARLRSMTLPELDARLADRFALLVGGDRTAPDRHRTLLAVIEWSRRLLTPTAAEALATLAIFPDGFTAESADVLLGGDATDVLTELVDQSLLTFVEGGRGGGRYRMLETVREFGLRDLAEHDRLGAARSALDAWALRFARRAAPGLTAGVEPGVFRTVAEEEESLLAVLRDGDGAVVRTAVGALLAEFWIYRGEFESIVGVLPMLLRTGARRPTSGTEAEEAVRALALAASISMIASQPQTTRALALLARAVRVDPSSQGFWHVLGRSLLLAKDPDSGIAALDGLTAHPDPLIAAFAYLMRAQLEENQGRTADAIADLVVADGIATRHGYSWFRFLGRTNIVSLRSQRGEHARALAMAREAMAEIVALDVETDLRQLEWLIGANAIVLGDLDEGERIFTALAASRGRGGADDEADNRAIAMAGLAEVATARGEDRDRTVQLWRDAAAVGRVSTSPWRVVVDAAAIAGWAALGVPDAELARPYRRLRTLLIALMRLQGARFDAPVIGSGMLALSAVLRRTDPATAGEVASVALAIGARRDLASIDALARGVEPAPLDHVEAARRAMELLRSPAVRRW